MGYPFPVPTPMWERWERPGKTAAEKRRRNTALVATPGTPIRRTNPGACAIPTRSEKGTHQ